MDLKHIFKVGDLVQMGNQFKNHPPIGTIGVVTQTQEHPSEVLYGEYAQYVYVYWAHPLNHGGQNYMVPALKLVASI